jgi:D-glycero-D-manno-heptose 1,7-bisphosphate phosphatase
MPVSQQTGEHTVPVLYCDIDGTIRHGYDELGRFVNTAEDVVIFDGVPELLWAYKELGWRIVGVSNQGGIALGYTTTQDVIASMGQTQVLCNMAFDKIAWCSHHPNAKDPEMAICWCRKPLAGMVIESALSLADTYHGDEIYPPHLGLMVGDRPEDQGCADNAGLTFLSAEAWRTGEHLSGLKGR